MTERETFILGLRQLADFLGTHPQCPAPWGATFYKGLEASDVRPVARALRSFKKEYLSNDFHMTKKFGSIELSYFTNRENVCKKVVVGHKDVPEMIISAKPEQLVPATEEQVIPAHTEEITEWICSESALMEEEPTIEHQEA